ncbi:hypothetical protein I6F09_04955 [Bradyrhizobium sp. IC3195]|uniref:hypothetical protein n=1 Tax=Bradyrhizobium sp. IC3195 TaxID=2793804 RepID=UPI001CD1C353|nr:hypothetical protein [Bradyrhizobium sp. IC3195]MCA1467236.1 hypothetical protein [Bradyrhizobium sp. IC3195]
MQIAAINTVVTTEGIVRQIHEAAAGATWPANEVDLAVVELALRQSLGAVQQEMSWRLHLNGEAA